MASSNGVFSFLIGLLLENFKYVSQCYQEYQVWFKYLQTLLWKIPSRVYKTYYLQAFYLNHAKQKSIAIGKHFLTPKYSNSPLFAQPRRNITDYIWMKPQENKYQTFLAQAFISFY